MCLWVSMKIKALLNIQQFKQPHKTTWCDLYENTKISNGETRPRVEVKGQKLYLQLWGENVSNYIFTGTENSADKARYYDCNEKKKPE